MSQNENKVTERAYQNPVPTPLGEKAQAVGAGYASDLGRQAHDPLKEAFNLIEADKAHRSLAADQALMLGMVMPYFGKSVDQLAQGIYLWNEHQGFWGKPQIITQEQQDAKKAEKIALMHSELSEMLEGIRNQIPNGEKGCEAEEAADLLIRLLDYCGGFNIDLAGAFHRKQLKNLQRPFKHGKQF